MKRNRNERSVGWAILLAAALCLTACGHQAGEEDEDSESTTAAVTPVTVASVTRGSISREITLTGSIAAPPNHDVRVSSLVPGLIAELRVAEGDPVDGGQVVARIDSRSYEDQVRQAEAAVAQAHANLDNATLALTRNQDLVNRGIAARKDLEDATMAKTVAEAATQQADAALALARLQLARTQIASPIAGSVVKRFVSVGEQVDGTAAQPIFEVANLGEVEMDGNLSPSDLGRLHVGQALHFTSEAFPGKTFAGRVITISQNVDPATNTGLVRVSIANPEGLLRLGMFVTARVPVETHANALLVPPQAVYLSEEGTPHVYMVNNDTADAVDVRLGIETADSDELLSGVKQGDTIILSGGYGLPDKAKVSVSRTNPGAATAPAPDKP